MRRMMAAVGLVCAAATPVAAQFTVPGQPVGKPFNLPSVGNPIPKAAPPAGIPIGSPFMKPFDPTRPFDVFEGTKIDPKSVVAPVSGLPGMPGEANFFERLYERIASFTGFFQPTTSSPPPTYIPGISRRNRERARERMWRRD